jgi:hypothetical protein
MASLLFISSLPHLSGHESAKTPKIFLSSFTYCLPLYNCKSGSIKVVDCSSHFSSYSNEQNSLPLAIEAYNFPINCLS